MKSPKRPPAPAPTPLDFTPPLAPHRRLFWILLGIVALWIAALLLMYLLTVRPHRDQTPAESGLPRPERIG
jgi:hypothetical protein